MKEGGDSAADFRRERSFVAPGGGDHLNNSLDGCPGFGRDLSEPVPVLRLEPKGGWPTENVDGARIQH